MRFSILLLSATLVAHQAPPPTPKPFPGAGSAPAAASPAAPRDRPATTPGVQQGGAPPATGAPAGSLPLDPLLAGIAIYPTADLLDSYDAGQGQRYFIFGTTALFADVVTYYKTTLRNGGRELFKAPGMQQFDLSRYQEESMAYPPSVVVKDYVWNGSTGYLYIKGRVEKRYPTIIQIVPR